MFRTQKRLRHAVLLILSCSLSPTAAATGSPALPAELRTAVTIAADGEDIEAFERSLRSAIATSPQHKQAILLYAVALRPDWAAELLLAALYDPPLTAASTPALSPPSKGPSEDSEPRAEGGSTEGIDAGTEATETEPSEQATWSGEAELAGLARSGNTENLGISGSVEITYELPSWRHILSGSFEYLEGRSETEAQAFEAEYQLQYDLSERSFAYGLGDYRDDRFSGFDYEITTSAGLGTKVIDEETLTWTLAAGPSLRIFQENDESKTEKVPGARFNSDLSWQTSETATLANETEVRLDSDRSEIENESSLTLQIIESLAGRFSFSATYRSPVPSDTEKLDTTTKASMIYGF